jgi:rSAM-associated Gly-rich repeat protein
VTLRRQYLRVLAAIASVGAVGVSPLLGSLASAAAREDGPESRGAEGEAGVAERLAAIRQAVSDVGGSDEAGLRQLAWWGNWRNGGGGAGGWRNGGWRNGGWRNGGWRNGGVWRNAPWRNFWRNW